MRAKYYDSIPKYQQIAIEVASKIVNGDYAEGDCIFGRSSIASQYNVSPETARRAFCILSDLDIVTVEKGSGTHIKSKKNAESFVRQFSNQKNIESIKDEIYHSIEHQKEEMDRMNSCLSDLILATEHYRSMNPLAPFIIRITSACLFIGKTIQDIQLWQHTGATMVAIKRNGHLLLSPGPYAILMENDILYYIAQDLTDQNVKGYLFADNE
jgi:K+/H+ antiporter YhaU regulatory subunit KhtT